MEVCWSNVYCLIRRREYRVGISHRKDMRVMRGLVCQKGSKFKKIFEKHTRFPVAYEGGRLYFENYRICYSIDGFHGLPQLLYRLPSVPTTEKIEDGLVCQCSLGTIPMEHRGCRSSFTALTANNWLIRYDLTTGEALQKVYLSNRYKFRHIAWQIDQTSFILRSVHSKMSTLARGAGIIQNVMMVLCVFNAFPLHFVGMMEVSKTIFGNDITDSMISQGLLVTMHQGGRVRLYSFKEILQQWKLFEANLYERCEEIGGVVGTHPAGLPFNIRVKECPPVLFQVRCDDHAINLGGFPWHFIVSPHDRQGTFHVKNLSTGELAEDGELDFPTISVEPDKCIFHHDDSGRILHVGANQIRILKLVPTSKPSIRCVEEDFSVKIENCIRSNFNQVDGVTLTSSGRLVKKRYHFLETDELIEGEYESIQAVDYEMDLDLLAVTSIHYEGETYKAKVNLYDNQTGELLQVLPLEEPWKEFNEHIVAVDLDTIIHISKGPMRKISCYVYRLDRHGDDGTSNQTISKESQAKSRYTRLTPNRRNTRARARTTST